MPTIPIKPTVPGPPEAELPRSAPSEAPVPTSILAKRGLLGGSLMGLANLVPGISGGTMLLASGVYPEFVTAVAEVTTLRFRSRSLLVLAAVSGAAAVAILLFAGVLKDLVLHQRWIMYSLFVGLTLGGLPTVWRLASPVTRSFWAGTVAGLASMVALTLARDVATRGLDQQGWPWLLVAGIAGAGAMILPGVSGGFLLLLLGQYVPILSAIDAFKSALTDADLAAALGPALSVLLPVGIGVLVGIVAVSNALRFLLGRHPQPTLGVLTGLLLGAVIGLWPFQEAVQPKVGDRLKGRVVTAESLVEIDPEDYPTVYFSPAVPQTIIAAGLIALGTAGTVLVSRWGQRTGTSG